MTMTLGFDLGGYLEVMFDEAVALDVIAALARQAPTKPLRVATYGHAGYSIIEIDGAGTRASPRDLAAIAAAIDHASFVDWANEDAPAMAPIILPGAGWDVAALLAEPAVKDRPDVAYVFADACGTDEARPRMGERCAALFDVAEQHRLVMVLR